MPPAVSVPVLSCAEAAAWEAARLPDASAVWPVMQRAGAALARAVLEDFRELGGLPDRARLLVLAGKGHNGGDALLAARDLLLARPQAHATLLTAFGPDALRPLACRALDSLRALGPDRVRETTLPELKRALAAEDVCLDGVFGFQFRPPLDAATAELLAWVNTHPRLRLRAAVDLPSGLGGAGADGTVFRADFTYATGIVKSPLLDPAHAGLVGRIRYLDLGFFADGAEPAAPAADGATRPRVLLPELLRPLAQLRATTSDKRTFGHLLVVGGSRRYPGAVLMAVRAALRSGVGLLTAAVPASLVPECAARFPEAMWLGWPENSAGGLGMEALGPLLEAAGRADAGLIGPGLGADPETLAATETLVRQIPLPTLLDADALRPPVVAAAAGRPAILTPHAGELARLGGAAGVPPGMVLVAKGYPTRVHAAATTGVSVFGGPVLARGGSGDLLAGLTAGLLAQAAAAGTLAPEHLWLAAARGVVWHGLAADLLARDRGQVAVQTTQWFDYLQPALVQATHDSP